MKSTLQEQKQINDFIAQNKVTYCEPYAPVVRQICSSRNRKYSRLSPLKREEIYSRVREFTPRVVYK